MRLARFAAGAEARLGLVVGDRVVDLPGAWALIRQERVAGPASLPNDMRAFLAAGDAALQAARQVEGRVTAGDLPKGPSDTTVVYLLGEVHLLAPIPDPEKLILLGKNYAGHAAETGMPLPKTPVLFAKFRNAITGPYDPIVVPKAAPDHVDYEAELAFVVGKRAKRVPLGEAYDYIAGYMALDDVSARDLQFEESQWLRGKTPDTFAPTGPWIVTRDEIANPQNLRVRCLVNGEVLQDATTHELIFDVPFLLHHISQTMTLEPGDIVSTGTPEGVGYTRQPPIYLHPGDIVRVEVEGVGALENPVVAED